MYQNNKILALIPARGGSKGIPGKNIKKLKDKPLLAYSIEAAKGCSYVDAVVVSTDSQEIAEVAECFGASVPCLRPAELATDRAKTIDAVIHMVDFLKEQGQDYDLLVLLQPTSPLRSSEDIAGAIRRAVETGQDVVSISEVKEPPVLMRTLGENNEVKPLLRIGSTIRRQDMPVYYRVNGSVYVNVMKDLNEHTSFNDNPVGYETPVKRSVDIDEPIDFVIAEHYLRQE